MSIILSGEFGCGKRAFAGFSWQGSPEEKRRRARQDDNAFLTGLWTMRRE